MSKLKELGEILWDIKIPLVAIIFFTSLMSWLVYIDAGAKQALLRYHGYEFTKTQAMMIDAEELLSNQNIDLNVKAVK